MAKLGVCLLVFFVHFLSISSPTFALDYKAASFEHRPYFILSAEPFTREEALRIMRRNTAVYSEQARAARKQEAQIIVFPEDGIYGFGHSRETLKPYLEPIPDVSDSASIIIPCTDPKPNTEILQELSCIARNNSIALVANMGDIQYCTKSDPNCPEDGRYQYNTDVVFDSDGRLLAKYHKQHLTFQERAFNTPIKCEFVTFVTSFQVRFGVFTCFDMLFKDPAIDLVQIYGVQNIVFPTAWFKGFPSLISIEFQQAWSRVNCVNLVAANLYLPSLNFTGSGIYSCGEAKTYIYDKESIENRLLVATLPGNSELFKNDKNDMLDHKAKRYRRDAELLKEFGTDGKISRKVNNDNELNLIPTTFKVQVMGNLFTLRKLTTATGELSVCADELCCNLKYSLPRGRQLSETFAMGAFKGDNPNGFYWEVCLLFKCASSEETSCGKDVVDSETIFESFTLYGNFSSSAVVYPTALGSGVSLFSENKLEFTKNGISGQAFEKPLLAASLIGRVFARDKEP